MDDPLNADLEPLAPAVDIDVAAASFSSMRRSRRRRRRLVGGAFASLTVAAIGLGALTVGGGGEDTVVAGPQRSTPVPTPVPTETTSEAEEPQPLTSTQLDIVDEALLPASPVEELQRAVGELIEVVPGDGDNVSYLVQFGDNVIWDYIDSEGSRVFGGSPLQEQLPVLIDPVGNAVIHDSCSADLFASAGLGDRVEAVAATGFDTTTDPISAKAWISISCVRLDLARRLWADSRVNVYQQLYEGRINGSRESALVKFADGVIRQRRLDPAEFGTYDVESVFDQMDDARAAGQQVQAQFEPELGYPTRVVIYDQGVEIVDLTSVSFQWAIREPGCETGTGSALDLSEEPLGFVLTGTRTRWQDPEGCPVRLDVISDNTGPPHCDLDGARFLTVGTPVGSLPEDDTRRAYVFDPDRTLTGAVRGEWGSIGGPELVPDSAVGTGYRSAGGFELWTDPTDAEYVWGVNGSTVQAWRQAPANLFNCA